MEQTYTLLIASAGDVVWDAGAFSREPKLYATSRVDCGPPSKTPPSPRGLNPNWNFYLDISCLSTSTITFQLHQEHMHILGHEDTLIGECKIGFEELLHQSSVGEVNLHLMADGNTSAQLRVRLQSPTTATTGATDAIQMLAAGLSGSRPGLGAVPGVVDAGAAAAQSSLASSIGACIGRIDALIQLGDKIAPAHPYISLAWNALTSVYKALKQQHDMDEEVVHLVQTMLDVYSFNEEVNFVDDKSKVLANTLLIIAQKTRECANFVHQYIQHGFAERTVRTIFLNEHQSMINNLAGEMVRLKESFDHAVGTQTLSHTTKILATTKHLEGTGLIEKLRHISYDASLRSECLDGTRQALLDELSQWATSPSDRNILWLSGVAGSGKSCIATSLSQLFRQQQCLGAFIFFTRNNVANSNPAAVLQTLAYKLAQFNTHIRHAISAAIGQNPDILDAPIRTQFETLLRGPLLTTEPYINKSVVIIIDALDECSDPAWRTALASLIADMLSTLPSVYRFLITSRPEVDIRGRFKGKVHTRHLSISAAETGTDIMLYIQERLKEVQVQGTGIPKEWPGESAIQQLAIYAGGLFIWAATACNYIQASRPQRRLKNLVAHDFKGDNRLDEMYTTALKGSGDWTGDDDFEKDTHAILGCIVLAKAPLRDVAIDSLLSLDSGTASEVLGQLGCVIHRDGNGNAQVLHASFSDYLLTAERSGSHPWNIRERLHHHSLALGCFHVLGHQLHFNICGLQDSHLLNSEVPALPTVLGALSPELCYASQYWGDHYHDAEASETLASHVQQLLEVNFLHWLEVISLLGKVQTANKVLETVQKRAAGGHLGLLLNDARRFLDVSSPVIAQSAPHIYVSALAFAPKLSMVRKNYGHRFQYVLRHNTPLDKRWTPLQKTLTGHTMTVQSIAFSPNGRQMISGSDDETIRIWDTVTGAQVGEPLKGHNSWVRAVAFSPDGRNIASGANDQTIRIWDSESGVGVGKPLTGHSDTVCSVAFSPDGRKILSGSFDQTMRIWDSETGALLAEPFKHSSPVYSVAFSPDGQQIVSASNDIIRLWDSKTGEPFRDLWTGDHDQWVTSVTFSPNGRQIAAGITYSLHLWDLATGELREYPLPQHHGVINSVAFSPDGRWIASGSGGGTVCLWDLETGALVEEPLTEHQASVEAVAFSPDGRQFASGSVDQTICIWDSETAATVGPPLTGHRDMVWSVAFSPDGRQIVSGSTDTTIQLSEAVSGERVGELLTGHSDQVTSVSFSPDGKQIVSGSYDLTIRIWDSETGAPVGEPLTGHHYSVESVAFSPDGKRIVSGSVDTTIRIWDSKTGTQVGQPLTGHHNIVFSVAFSPDGRHIVSGARDNTIRIWDSKTGEAVGEPLKGHTSWVSSVTFSPDVMGGSSPPPRSGFFGSQHGYDLIFVTLPTSS
ncbi:WD40-repeat-containing domain protein [Mycena pura]|uniref:WD40-repeat-containing domain protein n=1 Tax=Mycena pura TaxID=153505 RepID=A0AAD6YD84_9AGAR|nr:WD40-repeat-containing domain protein [Mycena pura]